MKRALPVFAALILSTAPAMAQDSAAAVAVPQHSSAAVSVADPMSEQIAYLQNEWARIKYQIPGDDEKITEIHKLEDHAAKVSAAYRDRAEPKIWEAIILSTEAGIVKGVSALPKVNRAKELLEQAEKIDTKALDGSAHTSLGSLYYQVPGWPIGFGDDALAEEHLKQALQINPEGIDPNFFYGDFLLQDGRYDEAKTYLNRALAAADRPGRALADAGRRQEAKAALAKIDEKLKTEGRNFN